MRIRIHIIGIVCLAILIASHWLAFYRGKKRGDRAHRVFGDQWILEAELRQLRAHVVILRSMVMHLDRFSQEEIMVERLKGEQALFGGERIVLPQVKKIGDEARTQEVEALVGEGRELWSKLPK